MPRRSTKTDPTTVTKPDMRELGLSGTRLLAGLISEETVPALQGQQAYSTYRGMRFDATGAAIQKAIELPIRSTRWFMNPASDDPEAVTYADFVHQVLWEFGSQSYDDVMRLALLSLVYGFSVLEIVYAPIDWGEWKGKIGWDNLSLRQANTKWRWNEQFINGRRQLVSMSQLAPPYYQQVDIPRNKFILWTNDLEGQDWDGFSIYRGAYKDYFIRDRLYRIRAIGLERSYMSVPVATLPDGYSNEEMELAKKIVTSIRSDESAGVTKPENLGLELVRWDINSSAMDSAILYHNRQMLSSTLAQFLDLGSATSGHGSFALSSDQSELFQNALVAKANYFAQQMNLEPAIPSLIGINFANVGKDMMPHLEHGDIGQRALDALGRTLTALAQFGFLTPDNQTEDRLRQMLDLPEREENVTADALRDLIPEVFPTSTEYGHTSYGPRLQSPLAVAAQQAQAGGQPGAAGAPGGPGAAAAQRAPMPPPGGAGPRSPIGHSPAGVRPPGLNAAEQAEYDAAYGRLQEVLVRKAWMRPKGRPTEEARNAMNATYQFTEALDGVYSGIKQQRKPEKPSIVLAKNRRPYNVQFSFADAADRVSVPQRHISERHQPALSDAMRKRVRLLPPRGGK